MYIEFTKLVIELYVLCLINSSIYLCLSLSLILDVDVERNFTN